MIELLTNLSEILKLIILIILQIGGILILLGLPFIVFYGAQNTDKDKEERLILRIKVKDKN